MDITHRYLLIDLHGENKRKTEHNKTGNKFKQKLVGMCAHF